MTELAQKANDLYSYKLFLLCVLKVRDIIFW
jgi:hypothetical protein